MYWTITRTDERHLSVSFKHMDQPVVLLAEVALDRAAKLALRCREARASCVPRLVPEVRGSRLVSGWPVVGLAVNAGFTLAGEVFAEAAAMLADALTADTDADDADDEGRTVVRIAT